MLEIVDQINLLRLSYNEVVSWCLKKVTGNVQNYVLFQLVNCVLCNVVK